MKLCRALLTGITRVSKESIFSDLNNLNVITTTSDKYCTAFRFTEKEMLHALKGQNLTSEMDHVRFWYDGFTFGSKTDIYNPWSITMYDVMMEPVYETDDAIVMEFKVFSKQKDKTLKKAVENALKQIEDMKYDSKLTTRGIPKDKIRHYGFAFDGQVALIGEG